MPDRDKRTLTRRRAIGLGLASIAAAGCGKIANRIQGDDLPSHIDLPRGDVHPTVRLLNRAGFGPKPGQIAEVASMGHEVYVDRQLEPGEEEPVALSLQLGNLEALSIDSEELRDESEDEVLSQIQCAALLRATYSPWQLRERMVDFWTNHFNIYAPKGLGIYRKATDDQGVIRKYALASFPQLLHASAHSSAMLSYLDNTVNQAGVPNENYARELMELHTLGLHGGYTQRDVQEVARCFTGWTVENRFGCRAGSFRYNDSVHDQRPKVVLGHMISAQGGEDDAKRVLDILSSHPSTARFISKKICRHFLGDPESPWVEPLTQIYLQTGGEIRAMMKPLLLSPELLHGDPVAKRPLDFVVSSLRAFDVETDGGPAIQKHLADMGQSLYEWPMPDGYPDRTSAWTGSLLARWNFAVALMQGQVSGTTVDLDRLDRKLISFDVRQFVPVASGEAPAPVMQPGMLDKASQATLALCSPEFQWR